METLLKCLKNLAVSDYMVIEKVTCSKEFFFIGKKIDLTRAKQVKKWIVTVYEDFEVDEKRYRGHASATIDPTMEKEALEKKLKDLKRQAQLGKEEPYTLRAHSKVDIHFEKNDSLKEVLACIQDLEQTNLTQLNSCEVFDEVNYYHMINSQGLDVSYCLPQTEIEMILNAKNDVTEVETYERPQFGNVDLFNLNIQFQEAMKMARDRLEAIPIMNTDCKIVLAGQNVVPIFNYYLNRLNAKMVYNQFSDLKIGQSIGLEGLNIEGLAYLEHSSKNHYFSLDGTEIQNVSLVKDGIVDNYWGTDQYLQYVGITHSSDVYNFKVSGGVMENDELAMQPHLKLVSFSDFNVDLMTGDYAGEIRLAYYYDENGNITPCTGGSISGNLKQSQNKMILSKQLSQYNHAIVPSFVVLADVNLAI